MNKQNIAFVYGGRSGEHEVSLTTAYSVMNAFDYDKYNVVPFYITKEGHWRTAPGVWTTAPATKEQLRLEGAEAISGVAALQPLLARLDHQGRQQGEPIDVVFPLLHGTFGEDGTIQGLFEMANIPYVGAGVLASSVGMDKIMMKKAFAYAGLEQCAFCYANRTQWNDAGERFLDEIESSLGYPAFVKPANLGSSVGISKATNRTELRDAIEYAFRYDRKVIVEEFVDAREVEVSVLGNDEPRASVVGEIASSNEFYDYKAKYIDGKSQMYIPAPLDAAKAEEVRALALKAYKAIDGSGLSRMDFFLRRADGKLLINEVNTLPGFTPFSMYPLMWKEAGVSYRELLDTLITLAVQRYEDKNRIQYTS